MKYPTIGDYNKIIQKHGSVVFNELRGIQLIPSRTSPIKVFLFGSGAYAVVFKGNYNGKTFAIRCFHSAEQDTIYRNKVINEYLKSINSSWKTESKFIENEITVNGYSLPVVLMEWVDGLLINQFVTKYLYQNEVLSELQSQLVSISKDLETSKIGHGDIQCGNIIIKGTHENFQIKLIDYDGMYVPQLANMNSLEKGRSEFQHPKRMLSNFNHKMDRFSFWVIITALEALKVDKTLWSEVMKGGFNTLDNFLFTIQDFTNPHQSKLIYRLSKLNSSSLQFYLDRLLTYTQNNFDSVAKLELSDKENRSLPLKPNKPLIDKGFARPEAVDVSPNKYKIVSKNDALFIFNSSLKRLGTTPIELDKEKYEGKVILISNGKETKRITLMRENNIVEVDFN